MEPELERELELRVKSVLRIEWIMRGGACLMETGMEGEYEAYCYFDKKGKHKLYVNLESQSFCCFKCHLAGDTIDFIAHKHELPRIEAIMFLVNEYGL
jgi:DNA primase